MISIIICSTHKQTDSMLLNNIASTIGDVKYEIVHIDNSANKYNIFQAYNIAVERAQYEYLCFIHEDIEFCSNNWGAVVVDALKEEKTGLVGVIGGCYIGQYYRYWAESGLHRGHIMQGSKGKSKPYLRDYSKTVEQEGDDVVSLDGMFLASRKSLFKSDLRWDDETYDGFHYYDLDMCMQVLKAGYKVKVLYDMLIMHKSTGTYNPSFFEGYRRFHRKWDSFLPVTSLVMTPELEEQVRWRPIETVCELGNTLYRRDSLFKRLEFKIAAKITLLLGRELW